MIASHLAMLAREYDDRIVGLSAFFERLEYFSELRIDQRHVGEILSAQLAEAFFVSRVMNVTTGLAHRIVSSAHVVVRSQSIYE